MTQWQWPTKYIRILNHLIRIYDCHPLDRGSPLALKLQCFSIKLHSLLSEHLRFKDYKQIVASGLELLNFKLCNYSGEAKNIWQTIKKQYW
jgi:hypothetical protein